MYPGFSEVKNIASKIRAVISLSHMQMLTLAEFPCWGKRAVQHVRRDCVAAKDEAESWEDTVNV